MVNVLLKYIDFNHIFSNTSSPYYAGIMLDTFSYLLCSKLYCNNRLVSISTGNTVQLKCNVASTRETRASDTYVVGSRVTSIVSSRITHKTLMSHSLRTRVLPLSCS